MPAAEHVISTLTLEEITATFRVQDPGDSYFSLQLFGQVNNATTCTLQLQLTTTGCQDLKKLVAAALAQGLPRRVAASKCPAASQAAKDLLPNVFLCTSGKTPSISPPEVLAGVQGGKPMILTESRTTILNITIQS